MLLSPEPKHALIATSRDVGAVHAFDQPLVAELAERGITAQAAVWNDRSVCWSEADFVLIRSCWDSHIEPDLFLDWIAEIESLTQVINSPETIRWCFDKRYLKFLEQSGVSIVPTQYFERGSSMDVRQAVEQLGTSVAMIKPSISADAYKTLKVDVRDPESLNAGQHLADTLLLDRGILVQPHLNAFDEGAETSLVFVNGEFVHAYSRPPILLLGEENAVASRISVIPDRLLLRLAKRAVSAAPPALWARVDIVDNAGTPMVNELELIDPNLMMHLSPNGEGYGMVADAIVSASLSKQTLRQGQVSER